jgi:16S rRNA pseudouridine516 synthase
MEAIDLSKLMRIDKWLSHMGIATRSECKLLVKQGAIVVDGRVVKDAGLKVNPATVKLQVSGEEVVYKPFIYVMMNKPPGVISATEDRHLSTVIDLLPVAWQHFAPFPVGRLDKDTEGLLLLTNDGKLAHELLSPRKHVPKTYYARIDGVVDEDDMAAFLQGVTFDDGYLTLPAQLQIDDVHLSTQTSEIRLTIMEGKFHQVKRMFAARGKTVTYLRRLSMGSLRLDESLALGESRELTTAELSLLKGEAIDFA